ncbi:uncharacterized protein LOC109803805 [Cajanus cajan]|uniref:uncharacterized protein LOC109803805 n=1 Tax=Cajanus cajan TaxID=3821 RepID=UPI0010FB61ED|nr:uncharacterized protein LOC109803805 [Cajanus cajan]
MGGLSLIKIAHVHAANSLPIQEQASGLIPLRQILENQIRLLDLRPTLIHQKSPLFSPSLLFQISININTNRIQYHSQIKPRIGDLRESVILVHLLHDPQLPLRVIRPMHLNEDLNIQLRELGLWVDADSGAELS